MKIYGCILSLITCASLLSADMKTTTPHRFSIELGAAFLHDDTYDDLTTGNEVVEDTYHGGVDFGMSYHLHRRHAVSLFTNLYYPITAHWGVAFTYGDKERLAFGPTVTFKESLYEPSIGAQLFVKNLFLRTGVSRYDLSDANKEQYGDDYGHRFWLSVGYSINMKRVNKRLEQ